MGVAAGVAGVLLVLLVMALPPAPASGFGDGGVEGGGPIRCYVCGGHTGRSCRDFRPIEEEEDDDDGGGGMFGGFGGRSPYLRPPTTPPPRSERDRQWAVCNDLINNKGCIKQVVGDVVMLRACWMQETDECLESGEAEVCTCTTDLCNAAAAEARPRTAAGAAAAAVAMAVRWWWLSRRTTAVQ